MTCACCCALPIEGSQRQRPQSWTAVPCNRHQKVEFAPATTRPKQRNGSKVHAAVDMLSHLLAFHVTAADEQDREQVEELSQAVQAATGHSVEVAFVDQDYTGQSAAAQAAKHDIDLLVLKHTQAKKGFVLLPRCWVVERSFGWIARFRRLARDCERLGRTVAGLHYVAFACLMLAKTVSLLATGS